jgi:ribonuclease P protein component
VAPHPYQNKTLPSLFDLQYSFPKTIRLRRQAEFDAVYKSKVFAADDVLVSNGAANGLPLTRLGLSVSRKVGNAVVRNRWKRCIREAFRQLQHELPPGIDIVIRPRKGAACDYDSIRQSLEQLTRRIAKKLM